MLTPAAKDHATNTRYTGIRAMVGSPNALSIAAMTKGKSVYPIMQIDWKKELTRPGRNVSRLRCWEMIRRKLTSCHQEA